MGKHLFGLLWRNTNGKNKLWREVKFRFQVIGFCPPSNALPYLETNPIGVARVDLAQ